jgi:hypothetical protein
MENLHACCYHCKPGEHPVRQTQRRKRLLFLREIRLRNEAEESILGYKESKENFQEVNTKAERYGKG